MKSLNFGLFFLKSFKFEIAPSSGSVIQPYDLNDGNILLFEQHYDANVVATYSVTRYWNTEETSPNLVILARLGLNRTVYITIATMSFNSFGLNHSWTHLTLNLKERKSSNWLHNRNFSIKGQTIPNNDNSLTHPSFLGLSFPLSDGRLSRAQIRRCRGWRGRQSGLNVRPSTISSILQNQWTSWEIFGMTISWDCTHACKVQDQISSWQTSLVFKQKAYLNGQLV